MATGLAWLVSDRWQRRLPPQHGQTHKLESPYQRLSAARESISIYFPAQSSPAPSSRTRPDQTSHASPRAQELIDNKNHMASHSKGTRGKGAKRPWHKIASCRPELAPIVSLLERGMWRCQGREKQTPQHSIALGVPVVGEADT